MIPNGDYEDRLNGIPRRFSFPTTRGATLSVSASESIVTFNDTTNRTANELVFLSDKFRIVPAPYACRAGVVLTRAASSATARVVFRFYGADQTTLTAIRVISQMSAVGSDTSDYTFGPVGTGCDVEFPAGTAYADYYCDLRGDTGARNFAGRFIHIGMFRGKAAPRKAAEDAENPVSELEPENTPYPPGSYMRVVTSPSWSQSKGNGFEFYGSALARLQRRYFASGLRLPVEPNRIYCLQASYYHEGLASGSELLPISIRNAAGEVVVGSTPTPLVGAVTGSSGGGLPRLAYTVVETGPDAAYIQVEPSTLGPGLARAWGFQYEYGTIPTAWTDDVAHSGILAAAFDTRTPDVDDAIAAAGIFAHRGFTGGGAVADLPGGTAAPVLYRGRNSLQEPFSDYYADVSLMPTYRYVEVEARPTADGVAVAAGESPEISGLFAEAAPPRAVLLRPDGSEYPGGVLVEGMPATQYGENAERSIRSDGAPRIRQTYPSRPEFAGVTLKAYSDEGAQAVSFDSTHGNRLFLLQGWGKTRLVRIINIRFGVDRMERIMGREVYVHTATDVSGDILREDTL